jgi:hypothetical protein
MEKGVGGLLKLSREEHFTVVLLANAHPNACVLALLFLSFLPVSYCMSLLLITNLTSCTSRDTNLSKTPG